MKRFTRRRLLQALGAGTAALPLVPLLEREVEAATGDKRIIFFFTPNGLYRPGYDPSGEGRSFTIDPDRSLGPLIPYRDDMLVLQGLDNEAWFRDPHRPPDHGFRLTLLTGDASKFLYVRDSGANFNTIGNISIDQFIARELAAGTP
jgi:hypothetical protein